MFILLLISFSDLPSSVIKAPIYVNVLTFSISFPSMCILVLGGLLLLENTIVFVFFAFIRSLKLSLSLLTWSTIFWRSSSVSASNTVSSAYRTLLITVTHYRSLFGLKLGLVPFVLQHCLPSGLAVSIHAPTFAVIA